MKLVSKQGRDDLAVVYVAKSEGGNLVEFVETLHNPLPREEKLIITISTLYGCPVNCTICDAGPYYMGRLSKEAMFWQIDQVLSKYYPDSIIPVKKLKVHFTRMGEPSFNMAVLDVINEFDWYFKAPGFLPSISSIAPKGSEKFFDELLKLKNEKFSGGRFQLQFSIHTTNEKKRDEMMPVKKWSFQIIAEYGERFKNAGDRKITLSFAPSFENEIDPVVIKKYFNPSDFLIKLTPLNATDNASKNNLKSVISHESSENTEKLLADFNSMGYEVIIVKNSLDEIKIGSTCGQNIFFNN